MITFEDILNFSIHSAFGHHVWFNYTQQKKFLDTSNSHFFQKCFIGGQLKANHRKHVDVFFILTIKICKIWLINKSSNHLNGNRYELKKIANVTIHQHTDLLKYHLLCIVEIWLQPIPSSLVSMKKTFTCFT